jgi:hypothetical protein
LEQVSDSGVERRANFLPQADPYQPDGVSFDASGTLSVPSWPQNEFIEPELNHRAHAAGVKVLLLLGGDFGGK